MKSKEALHWETWNTSHRRDKLNETTQRLGETVVDAFKAIPLPTDAKVLEVACGTGWLAQHLSKRGDYVGLDLAPAAIEIAKEHLPSLRFEVADFHHWTASDSEFDAIVCVDAIAYFHDQDLVVGKFARYLKPGRMIILTTLNPFVYARIWWVKPPGEGQARKWLTKKALHALLERHGFVVEKSWSILPDGDQGILRLVNGRKINKLASLLIPQRILNHWKELVGLGQFRVVVARLK